MALWPGSGLYYNAQIRSIDGDRADIIYSDGTKMEISVKMLRVRLNYVQSFLLICCSLKIF